MKQGEVVADRYELRKALDGGYYNEVWIAMDLRLERECLLKMPSLPPSSPEERDRLIREARTIASIPNKDHVAEVFDVGDWAGRPFFTQELLPGGSLAERLQKCGGKLQAAQFLQVFVDVCSGVLQAHQVGIIHGDLKPENIVFSAQESAKVVDFGTAFRLQAGTPPSHQVMATLPFQSPEHFRPRTYGKLDQRTDIWALGIIAYLVLTGRHPYEMPEQASYVDWADAVEAPPSLRHAPADWAPIISRCLQPQKRYRFPAVSDLIAELTVLHRTYASTTTARSRELYKQGVDLFNNGDLRQAAHILQEAARLNPSPTLLHWVGYVRQALNDIPGAREAYQQALEIEPTYVAARQAITLLDAVAELEPVLQDQQITCPCGNVFQWTVKDRRFYKQKGWPPPRFCRECRRKRKIERAAKTATPGGPSTPPAPLRHQGIAKKISPNKDWGFIACEGMPDIFFHVTGVCEGTRMPIVGQRVLFEIGPVGKNGKPTALDVEGI